MSKKQKTPLFPKDILLKILGGSIILTFFLGKFVDVDRLPYNLMGMELGKLIAYSVLIMGAAKMVGIVVFLVCAGKLYGLEVAEDIFPKSLDFTRFYSIVLICNLIIAVAMLFLLGFVMFYSSHYEIAWFFKYPVNALCWCALFVYLLAQERDN